MGVTDAARRTCGRTFRREMDTAASARDFTDRGSRARQNLMELKMAMVVKA